MKAAIIGGGYVGLVTAVGLAEIGQHTVCVEKNPDRLDSLRRGISHFYEPGLAELIARVRATGRFEVTDDLNAALVDAEVVLIAVGTPSTDAGINLDDVRHVAAEIGKRLSQLDRYLVVAVKSTVVPGTSDGAVREEIERASGMRAGEFGLCMNPEFLREGCAVADFLTPDRIVIGAHDARSADVMERLYAGFHCPVIRTSLRNAEMIKYTSNALLACLISFSNEMSRLCELVDGLDEETVMAGLHLDRRFWVAGPDGTQLKPQLLSYLRGGVGFGGSCFPKDLRALEQFAQSVGLEPRLLAAVRGINESRATEVVDIVQKHLGGSIKGRGIAVLGLAFKPDTDDTRESAGLRIVEELVRRGARVVGHDPMVTMDVLARSNVPNLPLTADINAALTGVDAAVIATSWAEYLQADWPSLIKLMAYPLVVDGRQVVPAEQRGRGFIYVATGMSRSIGPLP